MYLSQFHLNLDNPEARRDLGNPYEMHRTLARLVDGAHALWRQEGPQLLFLSEKEPQWSEVSSDYFEGTPRCKPFPLESLQLSGRTLTFRLQANPTKSLKEGVEYGKRGKRVQLFKEEEQRDWLQRQAERNGFRVLDCMAKEQKTLRFSKPKKRSKVSIWSCLFEGRLQVTDEELFRKALSNGVGRAKAFGFGLLSVGP